MPCHEQVNFIGRKGILRRNILAALEYNLCFTFVLASAIENTHYASILTHAIHSADIHFRQLASDKFYLVDSRFPYQPRYMASYKESNILYYIQKFSDETRSCLRKFRKTRERFNFKHWTCRNTIEC